MDELELQQYLFDLQGYLVIENALSQDEVAELNRLIDAQNLPPPEESPRFGSAPTLGASLIKPEDSPESQRRGDRAAPVGSGFLNWGKPFCDLLDHPAIMPVLRLRLGDAFRLDRLYGMYMRKGQSYFKLHADYGASAPQENVAPGEYYAFRSNQIYEGFIVVAWALSDAGTSAGRLLLHPRQPQEPLPSAAAHQRGGPPLAAHRHAGDASRLRHPVQRSADAWHSRLARRARAAHAAV